MLALYGNAFDNGDSLQIVSLKFNEMGPHDDAFLLVSTSST